MNLNVTPLISTYLIITCFFILQPWFSRKNVVFGIVFADDHIWESSQIKKIRRRYMIESAASAFLIIVGLYLLKAAVRITDAQMINVSVILLIIVDSLVFVISNRRTRAFKRTMQPDAALTSRSVIVEMKKSDRESLLPLRWMLLLVPLFVATLAVAWFGYPYMSESIPTHFGLTGPDRWSHKSWPTVLSPAYLQVMLALIILFIRRAPASVRGNPDAAPDYDRFRKIMGILMIALGLIAEVIFLVLEISFIHPVSPAWFFAGTIAVFAVVLAMILLFMRLARAKHAAGPILDDDGRWIWGMFYFNPSDPSIFVEKRVGIGYTINMARPIAWIVLIGIIAITIILSNVH